jgi:multiple sugar transport system permease protein
MAVLDNLRALPQKARARNKPHGDLMANQRLWGWIFVSPWIIGFIVFTAAPIIFSLIFTFTNFNLADPDKIQFIGLANWKRLFSDPIIFQALTVTFKFAAIAIPFGIVLPVALASLLHSKYLRIRRLWMTLIYLPYVVPAVSGAFVWGAFLNGDSGWLNRILRIIGIENPPHYLQSEYWILPAFVLVGVWGVGNSVLIMLASMQAVPTEYYEAAQVDGAGGLTQFRVITLPMISPVIFYNLVLSVIGLMQYFTVPYVFTLGTGDPNKSAYFIAMYFYKTAFSYLDMGYGATQAWMIFGFGLLGTIILFATARFWVFYPSGD